MLQIYEKVPSKMATIMVTFDGGARAEGDKFSPGLAHMLEHMMFKGTETRTSIEIPREIALLGGSTNAFTSNEMVSYFITVPYENLEQAMAILSDITTNSTFPEDEFLKEREVVLEEEAEGQASIDTFLWDSFAGDFFTGRLSSTVIGTKESIEGFTLPELKKFYKKFYSRRNAVVAMSSCLGKREAGKLMRKYFGRNSKNVAHNVPVYSPEYGGARQMNLTRPLIEHAYVWMCYPGRTYGTDNEAADSVMLSILGSGMDSRLFENIREKHGLCYGIHAGGVAFRDQGSIVINSSTRAENVDKLVGLVNDEVEKMQNELITEEELLRSQNQFRAQTYSLAENSKSAVSWATKRAFFGLSDIDAVSEGVAALTREDIRESAQRYFDREKELLMVVRPEES
jgi:predicted Zn-dependent peptidase